MIQPQLTYVRPKKIGAYKKQCEFMDAPERFTIVEATTKAGKAQPLDAIVKTPEGNKLMGELAKGDRVFTPFGVSSIAGIYPQGKQEVYRVEFSDGSATECTKEHLWEVHYERKYLGRGKNKGMPESITQEVRKDKRGWPRVLTLEQIMGYAYSKRRLFHIPLANPVQYPAREVKIHPYLMGALLGNGTFKYDSVFFSTADVETVERLRDVLPKYHRLAYRERYDYAITAGNDAASLREKKQTLMSMLKAYGLKGRGSESKFIPMDYIFNSIDVRMDLLRGLFDTDGYVDKHGQAAIELTSKELIDGIQEIVESLGGVVKRSEKQGGYRNKDGVRVVTKRVYRMTVLLKNHRQLFSLERKQNLCRERKKPIRRNIRHIEYIGEKECQCIEIWDKRGLYLTHHYISTHNTVGCIVWLFEQAIQGKNGDNYWWVAPTYPVAKIAFRRMCRFIQPKEVYVKNESELSIKLVTGGHLFFKSADNPDGLYGEDVKATVLDEATRMKEDSWFAVFTTLSATNGKCKIIGNVKGSNNWVYRLAREAEAGHKTDWRYFKITASDAVQAGILSQEVVNEAERTLPHGVFLELYYGIPFENASDKFCFSFSEPKHARKCGHDNRSITYLSFDFNVNPISCDVIQWDNNRKITVPEVIQLENSNIYRLCDVIKVKYPNAFFRVTGDASGKNRSTLNQDNLNNFDIIKQRLGLGRGQMDILQSNIRLEDSQTLVNAVLEHYDIAIDPDKAAKLIFDMKFAEVDGNGKLKKADRGQEAQQLEALDGFRYFCQRYLQRFLKTVS
jgi:hypothetical protein